MVSGKMEGSRAECRVEGKGTKVHERRVLRRGRY